MVDKNVWIPKRDIYEDWSGFWLVLMHRPSIKRILQPAGDKCRGPRPYRSGFCLRLPRGHILIVDRCKHKGFASADDIPDLYPTT